MSGGPVGIGVIGTGFGRIAHVPAFLKVRGASVVGIASSTRERAERAAAEHSLPRAFASWQELVACPQIHAVSIATPPRLHAEITLAACAAGKAVLCEKPMAMDVAEAGRMLDAAQQAGVAHAVDFEFREMPAWRYAKRLIESGALGPLRQAHVTWILQSWAVASRPWSWRADREQGGGALGAWGVHVFDYVEWLLGPIASVAAHLSMRISHRPDAAGSPRRVSAEDGAELLLELADGAPATVVISATAPRAKGHWVEIYGEKKVLVIGSDHLTDYGKECRIWEGIAGAESLRPLAIPAEFQLEEEPGDGRVAPVRRLAQRFVDAIREGRRDVCPSFEDGLRAQALLEASMRAHHERAWIDVAAGSLIGSHAHG